MNDARALLSALPFCLSSLVDQSDPPEELRMRRGTAVLTKRGGVFRSEHLICTDELMEKTLSVLTNRSFYTHAETVNEGYLSLPGGLRVGICGSAITEGGRIRAVRDISFLCLRIPRPLPGAADRLFFEMQTLGRLDGVLVYSPPGVGKTTVLRELARLLTKRAGKAVALIDTRGELSAGLEDCPNLAVYLHYPKAAGLAMAVRTVAPDTVILDEIGPEECEGLFLCGHSGVQTVASAHAASADELFSDPGISKLIAHGVFSLLVGLERRGGRLYFTFERVTKKDEAG